MTRGYLSRRSRGVCNRCSQSSRPGKSLCLSCQEIIHTKLWYHVSIIQARAKKYNSLCISKEDIKILLTSPCHYCGGMSRTGVSGIDRIDSSKGYITGNVLSCCWMCNRAKSNTSYDAFMAWIQRIALLHTQEFS